jgi:hypothetical protein
MTPIQSKKGVSGISALIHTYSELWLNNSIYSYLHVRVPSMASKDLWMYVRCRRLNHFTSKLTNSIQNLVKVPMGNFN